MFKHDISLFFSLNILNPHRPLFQIHNYGLNSPNPTKRDKRGKYGHTTKIHIQSVRGSSKWGTMLWIWSFLMILLLFCPITSYNFLHYIFLIVCVNTDQLDFPNLPVTRLLPAWAWLLILICYSRLWVLRSPPPRWSSLFDGIAAISVYYYLFPSL